MTLPTTTAPAATGGSTATSHPNSLCPVIHDIRTNHPGFAYISIRPTLPPLNPGISSTTAPSPILRSYPHVADHGPCDFSLLFLCPPTTTFAGPPLFHPPASEPRNTGMQTHRAVSNSSSAFSLQPGAETANLRDSLHSRSFPGSNGRFSRTLGLYSSFPCQQPSLVPTRSIAESVFLTHLVQQIREQRIDLDATADALHRSEGAGLHHPKQLTHEPSCSY